MPRPIRCRQIGQLPLFRSFSPDDIDSPDTILMTVDEYEVLRLLDEQGINQDECASRMNVSRTTVTAIYERARKKIADMLVNGKRLMISGGNYHFPRLDIPAKINTKGEHVMRIAVPYENEDVFQHFGRSEHFKLYDIEEGNVVSNQIIGTDGNGHGALAGFLQAAKVDVLICGGIGRGAQLALSDIGIELYAGVQGNADEAVNAFIHGTLAYDPNAHCDHHDHHGNNCADHDCAIK